MSNFNNHNHKPIVCILLGIPHALTHWGQDKMNAISQRTFSSAFSCMKMFELHIKISLKFVPKGPINNIPALVQIMAWRRLGYKPLSEPMMVSLAMHVWVTRPQWVKYWHISIFTHETDWVTTGLHCSFCGLYYPLIQATITGLRSANHIAWWHKWAAH